MLRERARAMANEKEMRDTEEEKENEGDQNNKTDDVEGYEAEREARMAKNAERMKSTGVMTRQRGWQKLGMEKELWTTLPQRKRKRTFIVIIRAVLTNRRRRLWRWSPRPW